MERRDFIKVLGASATSMAITGCGSYVGKSAKKQPNILLILVDDLGYGDLSCYGSKDVKTPNIDKLMAAGRRFDPFWANCPVCSPTRAAIMTGRYPDLVGVPGVIRTRLNDNFGQLTPNAVMLPDVLKKAGYHSAAIGKWHLGLKKPNWPNSRGFDFFHGFLGDMMDDYYHHRRRGYNYMRLNENQIDPKGHATDLFSDWAVDYIYTRKDKTEPFFLYLAYNAPHTPIQPPTDWLDKVKNRETDISDKRAKLVALIEHLDDGIGKVIDGLTQSGLAQDTLVIFTSDNGGQVNVAADNGSLRGGKQDMWEGGLREPMCAVWPQKIAPSSKSDWPATTMDLFPTICQAAAAGFDHKIDGLSFLPAMLGKRQPHPDRIIFWMRLEGNRYKRKCYYAARQGDWKLLQNNADQEFQLFNLREDPREQKPLGREHKQYKILHDALMAHIKMASHVPWQRDRE